MEKRGRETVLTSKRRKEAGRNSRGGGECGPGRLERQRFGREPAPEGGGQRTREHRVLLAGGPGRALRLGASPNPTTAGPYKSQGFLERRLGRRKGSPFLDPTPDSLVEICVGGLPAGSFSSWPWLFAFTKLYTAAGHRG